MKRLLIPLAALAASLVIAACGSDSSSDSGSATAASASGDTVAVKSIGDVGDVLVDSSGKALYSSDVEKGGKVLCTGACESFWTPLTIDSGKPTGAGDTGKLGVVKRPDGARQVTADGKLLYTFSEDSVGKVTGNGFEDDFDGKHFTWTVMAANGKSADTGGSDSGGGSSNPYGY